LSQRRFEYEPWLASCVTLKPIPASARPSDSVRSAACHQPDAANIRSVQDAAAHATITALLR
jgi:hypothetical protein